MGCYLRHDKVSRVLKAWRWWSKHKAWIPLLLHCEIRWGGGGGGLNGNLPNLLTLLCWMGGTRGTWLRPHSGIIKAQSLDIRHVVQIPPSFTRAWWRPLSQVHKEVQFLLLVLQHFLSPNQQATTVPVNHIHNFPHDAYFENYYISRNGCMARLRLSDPTHFFF